MSGGLRTRLDGDRVIVSRDGGKATLWFTRGEIQYLWQCYRPDKPVRIMGTIPLDRDTTLAVKEAGGP